jgi:Tfp pilus assembly protein PilF
LALCHAHRGEALQAVYVAERSVAARPDNARYRNNLAELLVATGRYDDAIHVLAAVYPASVAYHNVGFWLYQKNHPGLASRYLQQAVALDPNMTQSQEILSRIHDQGHVAQRYVPAPQSSDPFYSYPRTR